jgi:hypothetical protein
MEKTIEELASKRGYVVTEEGTLLSHKGTEIGSINSQGYYSFQLRVGDRKINLGTHRLQAFQKYGSLLFEEGIMVRHKNGDPLDNSWKNILIGTNSDNQMDIPEQVRIKRAKHATSFIRKYNKREVKSFYKACKSYKKTMEEFGISSKGTLHYIVNN